MIIKPGYQISDTVRQTYEVLARGGVALVPFNVAYALNAQTPDAVARIFKLKGRPSEKRCVVLGNVDIFKALAVPEHHSNVGFTYPVGLVTRVNPESALLPLLPENVLLDGTVAIFLNMGELGSGLADFAASRGGLIFGSSANTSGNGNHFSFEDVEASIRDRVDIAIDGGRTPYTTLRQDGKGVGSTIIDLINRRVVREGMACAETVREAREMGLVIHNYP